MANTRNTLIFVAFIIVVMASASFFFTVSTEQPEGYKAKTDINESETIGPGQPLEAHAQRYLSPVPASPSA